MYYASIQRDRYRERGDAENISSFCANFINIKALSHVHIFSGSFVGLLLGDSGELLSILQP